MYWNIIKFLFGLVKFKTLLKDLTNEKLDEYKDRAIKEQNYELAAYLEYYIKFKK